MKKSGAYVNYHPEEFKLKLGGGIERNLDKAAVFLVGRIKRSFGSAPPEPRKDGGGNKKRMSKGWRRKNPSKPGDPPNVQTGTMRRSIGFEKDRAGSRKVGSSMKPRKGQGHSYPFYLELGTRRMKKRPWLRRRLVEDKRELTAILTERVN